jgi:hypothetical protein
MGAVPLDVAGAAACTGGPTAYAKAEAVERRAPSRAGTAGRLSRFIIV